MRKPQQIIIIVLLLISYYTHAQDINKFQNRNSIQLDLGGHGLFYSLNYERIIINSNIFKTAGQAGLSYYPPSTGIRDLWIPIGLNEIYSFGKHHIEAGLGFVTIREAVRDSENNASEWFWSGIVTGRIGYRYQNPNGRLILRAGFTPFLELGSLEEIGSERIGGTWSEFHPFGGISIGYNF